MLKVVFITRVGEINNSWELLYYNIKLCSFMCTDNYNK